MLHILSCAYQILFIKFNKKHNSDKNLLQMQQARSFCHKSASPFAAGLFQCGSGYLPHTNTPELTGGKNGGER